MAAFNDGIAETELPAGPAVTTGVTGEPWVAAAEKVGQELGALVSPDKHIGWRSLRLPADSERALDAAKNSILGREEEA